MIMKTLLIILSGVLIVVLLLWLYKKYRLYRDNLHIQKVAKSYLVKKKLKTGKKIRYKNKRDRKFIFAADTKGYNFVLDWSGRVIVSSYSDRYEEMVDILYIGGESYYLIRIYDVNKSGNDIKMYRGEKVLGAYAEFSYDQGFFVGRYRFQKGKRCCDEYYVYSVDWNSLVSVLDHYPLIMGKKLHTDRGYYYSGALFSSIPFKYIGRNYAIYEKDGKYVIYFKSDVISDVDECYIHNDKLLFYVVQGVAYHLDQNMQTLRSFMYDKGSMTVINEDSYIYSFGDRYRLGYKNEEVLSAGRKVSSCNKGKNFIAIIENGDGYIYLNKKGKKVSPKFL